MLVDLIANSEKLITEDRRAYYNKNDYKNDVMDDNFNNYKKSDNIVNHSDTHKEKKTESDRKNESEKDRKSESEKKDNNRRTSDRDNDEPREKTEKEPIGEELELLKLDMLRKLGELKSYGVTLSKNYSMDDDYKMMVREYKIHMGIKNKKNWIEWVSGGLLWGVKGAEMANDQYNPYDIKLSGWQDEVSQNMSSYYDILGEIYEHYNEPGKNMNPIFKLVLNLLGSAGKKALITSAIKNMPSKSEKLENNSELVEKYRQKARLDSKTNLDEKIAKEHDDIAQKMKDLHLLQEQKLTHQQMKMTLEQEGDELLMFKKGLELSPETAKDVAYASMRESGHESMSRHSRISNIVRNNNTNTFSAIKPVNQNVFTQIGLTNKQLSAYENAKLQQSKEQATKLGKLLLTASSRKNKKSSESEMTMSTDTSSRTSRSSKITKNKNLDKILQDSESDENSNIKETISVGSMKNKQSNKK
jgi:hypothetical protein